MIPTARLFRASSSVSGHHPDTNISSSWMAPGRCCRLTRTQPMAVGALRVINTLTPLLQSRLRRPDISVNRRSRRFCTTTRVYLCAASTAMHKTPKDIARSLRAFRNAHRLGLLRCVRILPGKRACEAQERMEYLGNAVPRLPLAQCTRAQCECDYFPTGTKKLQRMDVNRPTKNSREK